MMIKSLKKYLPLRRIQNRLVVKELCQTVTRHREPSRNRCFPFRLDIDDLALNPCENGGSCTDGVNDYSCKCADGFEGKNCSTSKEQNSTGSLPNNFLPLEFDLGPLDFTGSVCEIP